MCNLDLRPLAQATSLGAGDASRGPWVGVDTVWWTSHRWGTGRVPEGSYQTNKIPLAYPGWPPSSAKSSEAAPTACSLSPAEWRPTSAQVQLGMSHLRSIVITEPRSSSGISCERAQLARLGQRRAESNGRFTPIRPAWAGTWVTARENAGRAARCAQIDQHRVRTAEPRRAAVAHPAAWRQRTPKVTLHRLSGPTARRAFQTP